MNVDDNQNDGLAEIDLLAGGEQSDASGNEQDLGADANTETEDTPKDLDAEDEGEKVADSDADKGADEDGKDKGDEGEKDERRRPSGSERLKRRLAALQAENEQLRGRAPAPAAGDEASIAAAVEARIGKPPKQEDYTDYLEYERAATAYELDKRQASREVRSEISQAQARQDERFEDLVADHKDRLSELEKALPGARKSIQSLSAEIAPGVGTLILESEKSALLAYYLAKNPEKLTELNGMSERAAAREIGRLEARLSLPKPKTTTSAPPPITTPRGSAAVQRDPAKMSMDDYASEWKRRNGVKS